MTGQNWRPRDRTGLQDFPSGQDRTGGQEIGQFYKTSHLNKTELGGKRQDRTAGVIV